MGTAAGVADIHLAEAFGRDALEPVFGGTDPLNVTQAGCAGGHRRWRQERGYSAPRIGTLRSTASGLRLKPQQHGSGSRRAWSRATTCVVAALAAVMISALITGAPSRTAIALDVPAVAVPAAQLSAVRAWLNRPSDAVLAGEDPARHRFHAHLRYVGLEPVTVPFLLARGCLIPAG
ncbi:hypothetical protein AB0D11_23415 [Streptomyces monashensis]|uniref:hypothetical protein n=1 Tax=Streptomyces monashensis TaxID=1678012 RepID=UPI003406AA2A